MRDQAACDRVVPFLKRGVARIQVRDEVRAVIGDVARRYAPSTAMPKLPPSWREEIDQARRLLRFLRLQVAEGDVVNRRKQQAKRKAR